ncbi:MAG TPA: universal stress protein [Sulfuricella sp.]|nr:universal stress protein [Sulfuricella sp.]
MYKKIVVAVDGSSATEAALNQAVQLARQSGSALTGVFVLDGNWADFIGNDWQSSKGARQGFLDHIREEQEEQARAAHSQFEAATKDLGDAKFELLGGDPTGELVRLSKEPATDLIIVSRQVFQVSGRPSLKSLAKTLVQKATQPLLLLP